jgi:uroporphyrinogen decarboxylase
MDEMEPRERVLRTLRRQVPDRVPCEAVFTMPVEEEFRLRTGAGDYETYFGMDRRSVSFRCPQPAPDFSPYYQGIEIPSGAFPDEWGNLVVKGAHYRTLLFIYPLRKLKTTAELEAFPFPDFRQAGCHTHLDAEVKSLHARGLAVTGDLWGTFFERSWHLRGMDNLFFDFLDSPDFANALLDKMLALRIFMATRFAEAGVDILHTGDDLGMQHSLLMSVPMWRKWIKPRLAQVWAAARRVNPKIILSYHSDGFIEPFIPELIEMGLDVLNPIQPECMHPAAIKHRYGDHLAFFGTIGTQTTLPFGSPDEVRREVRQRIETVGKGGGLILAPSHILEPDVPWENILAFFEAAEEYGHYTP